MKTMDNQEIMETVAKHLLKQGRRSLDADGRCMYRAPNGDKCAVGCLLPDDLYDVSFEGVPVPSQWNDKTASGLARAIAGVVSGSSFPLLAALQLVHDTIAPENWSVELSNTAIKFNLKVTW